MTDPSKKKQETLSLEPAYDSALGVKFEFTGTLLIPAPGETERMAQENLPDINPVCLASPTVIEVKVPRGHRFAQHRNDFKRVKMNPLDALRFRQREN